MSDNENTVVTYDDYTLENNGVSTVDPNKLSKSFITGQVL